MYFVVFVVFGGVFMSFEDEAREKMYLQNLILSKNEADFQRRMQNTDRTINFIKDVGNAIGNSLTSKPAPPPSGGNIAGKVLAGAVIAGGAAIIGGGAYLLKKLFSDKKESKDIVDSQYTKNINELEKKKQILKLHSILNQLILMKLQK